jgi:hypothetical protein
VLTTLPPSCADCLEIWEPQGLSRLLMGLLYHLRLGFPHFPRRVTTKILYEFLIPRDNVKKGSHRVALLSAVAEY